MPPARVEQVQAEAPKLVAKLNSGYELIITAIVSQQVPEPATDRKPSSSHAGIAPVLPSTLRRRTTWNKRVLTTSASQPVPC